MKDPKHGAFAEILSQLESQIAPSDDDLPAVGEAIRAFRQLLGDATNMGVTADDRDLYVLLDRLVAAVVAAYPGGLCKAGCSACCDSHTAVFDVSPAEWAALDNHMATRWTEAERQAFFERFESEHGPRLGTYRALAAIRFFEPVADHHFGQKPYRCPFLVEGRCSVYAARPLACRMYGHFATRTRWYAPPAIYACRKQADFFSDVRDREPLHLPSSDMVVARAKRLMGGRMRILPFWIERVRRQAARSEV
ncbi:MAG: YkgJ family cysteine cluster protein [Candidatus Sericytochromatia bacterium]